MSRKKIGPNRWKFIENGGLGSYVCDSLNQEKRSTIYDESQLDTWWADPSVKYRSVSDVYRVGGQDHGRYLVIDSEAGPCLEHLPAGCYIHRASSYSGDEFLDVIDPRTDMFLPLRDSLNTVREDLHQFSLNKDIYAEFKAPYRRGYLLYGPPGNGKTAQIRNLVHTTLADCIVIWLNGMPSNQMRSALAASPLRKVFVIEEITNHNNNAHAVSAILEFFDGETSIDNCIIIGTTNYPEELQKNLIDRPGRFDVVAEVPNLTEEEAKAYFEAFLKRPLAPNEVNLKNLSVAYVKELAFKHRLTGQPLQTCYDQIVALRDRAKHGFPDRDKKKVGL